MRRQLFLNEKTGFFCGIFIAKYYFKIRMKRLAFLFGLMVIGVLILLESSEKKSQNFEQVPHQQTDEDVWLGN